jgi:hypothetical protein
MAIVACRLTDKRHDQAFIEAPAPASCTGSRMCRLVCRSGKSRS